MPIIYGGNFFELPTFKVDFVFWGAVAPREREWEGKITYEYEAEENIYNSTTKKTERLRKIKVTTTQPIAPEYFTEEARGSYTVFTIKGVMLKGEIKKGSYIAKKDYAKDNVKVGDTIITYDFREGKHTFESKGKEYWKEYNVILPVPYNKDAKVPAKTVTPATQAPVAGDAGADDLPF